MIKATSSYSRPMKLNILSKATLSMLMVTGQLSFVIEEEPMGYIPTILYSRRKNND
jgi:hypothetical protein